ncbi:MAG: patatin-like phospholipase family protein [Deltaproteobacteria bacterium]|nr:patatin-like phospholipase family protein [Deltaproteobacteria bacterium]
MKRARLPLLLALLLVTPASSPAQTPEPAAIGGEPERPAEPGPLPEAAAEAEAEAEAEAGLVPGPEPALRFALAISGGASKGAYEAGLTWGLLELLARTSGEAGVDGGRLRTFRPASFSGASAGAINTLLAGLSWCSLPEEEGGLPDRLTDNVFRDAWIPPDLNRMLPSRADSDLYAADDALFARHDLLVGARALKRAWRQPRFRPGCEISLGVTLTRVEPEVVSLGNVEVENQKFFVPFVMRVGEDRRVRFVFEPDAFPGLADPDMLLLPRHEHARPFLLDDERVLDAIFTSSAFPVAFGRRRLLHCRPGAVLGDAQRRRLPPEADQLVCPAGYVLAEADFADGGLFDNLPIGLARRLAESGRGDAEEALPATYLYVDPHRVRSTPEPKRVQPQCERMPHLPVCREREFSVGTESSMLLGAVGTARTIQLYQELAGESWRNQLPGLARETADALEREMRLSRCDALAAFFEEVPDCPAALRRGAALLGLLQEHQRVPVDGTLAREALEAEGILSDCLPEEGRESRVECRGHPTLFRERLAWGIAEGLQALGDKAGDLARRLSLGRASVHADRHILVTSRGAPITGALLGDFAALLEREFREYDYQVGVYDAVVLTASYLCERRWEANPHPTGGPSRGCLSRTAERLHDALGLDRSPRGRYLFALLARREFGPSGQLAFAYAKMPVPDRTFQTIYEGLEKARSAPPPEAPVRTFRIEYEFFQHLKAEGFEPTPLDDGGQPLLAQIMADPGRWAHEITRRMTTRLVLLEKRAQKLYRKREPDRRLRQRASPGGVGAAAHALQSATYIYPRFSFAPSTAPEQWYWRYVIPYEVALDLHEGDILLSWQPTWSASARTKVGLRASFGIAGGLFPPAYAEGLENYFVLGLDLTGLFDLGPISSLGATPMYHRTIFRPDNGLRDGAGIGVHTCWLGNRLRVGVGFRNVKAVTDTWFILVGVTDIPGFVYWLSR